MSIQKIGPLTEIKPGQWICREPLQRDAICSRPEEVVRRIGKRVYYRNRHGEDEGAYCALKTILALCDTKEEAESLFEISKAQFAKLDAVRAEHAALFEGMLSGSANSSEAAAT